MKKPAKQDPRLLTMDEVIVKTSKKRASIYRYMGLGTFPLPIKLRPFVTGRRPVAWIESEVDQWLKDTDPLTRMERATYKQPKKRIRKRGKKR